jgi:hypothetical protein
MLFCDSVISVSNNQCRASLLGAMYKESILINLRPIHNHPSNFNRKIRNNMFVKIYMFNFQTWGKQSKSSDIWAA